MCRWKGACCFPIWVGSPRGKPKYVMMLGRYRSGVSVGRPGSNGVSGACSVYGSLGSVGLAAAAESAYVYESLAWIIDRLLVTETGLERHFPGRRKPVPGGCGKHLSNPVSAELVRHSRILQAGITLSRKIRWALRVVEAARFSTDSPLKAATVRAIWVRYFGSFAAGFGPRIEVAGVVGRAHRSRA